MLGLIAAQDSLVFLAAIANLYLCAVPMAGLFWETKWIWAAPDPRFPDIPQAGLVELQNSFGLRYYAPNEGNQSFDSALPASNRGLSDIGLPRPRRRNWRRLSTHERRSTPLTRLSHAQVV